MKLRRLTIGWTEHVAEHRAYRTLCGRSVELATPRRKPLDKCGACEAAAEEQDR